MLNQRTKFRAATSACLLFIISFAVLARADFAATVIDYHPGAGATLTNPYAATGHPEDIVAAGLPWGAIASVFNPHYEAGQITQIGEGGDLTLRLDRSILLTAGMPELCLVSNTGLADGDYPNGLNTGAFGIDTVTIEVSENGLGWTSLGSVTCDFPSNQFCDAPGPFHPTANGLQRSDFSKPHALKLADLDGMNYSQIVTMLDGSAGGNWIDLDSTGLSRVSYIRLSVPDDADSGTQNTFELAAVSINAATAGPTPVALSLAEDFATDPIGSRATSDPGHASYANGALTVGYDLAAPVARTSWPLGGTLTDADSFSYSVEFSIRALEFTTSNFGQLSFGLINAATTGDMRTSVPSDAWDLLMVDYFPNGDFTTFSPVVIGSQRDGQTNAFDNLGFPSGSASLINEFDEVGQLPLNTPLNATLDYEANSRTLTLRLAGLAINAWGPDPDGDDSTIEYVIPEGIDFAVDRFAIVCWHESSGGSATLEFTALSLNTPSPPANYYTWADANIDAPIDRATGADANHDTLSNLLDYALGGVHPKSTVDSGQLRLRWQEVIARDDVTVTPRSSADLRNWLDAADSIISSGPDTEIHQSTTSFDGTRKFLHLNATRR